MYDTAADMTGVLIARATGTSFGDALRQRICDPLEMTRPPTFRLIIELSP